MENEPMENGPEGGRTVVRAVWAAAGFVCFGVGAVGVVLPVIPTTPLILLAAICFARSSARLNAWFKRTKLYRQVFEGFVRNRTMTVQAKVKLLVPVSAILLIAMVAMHRLVWGVAILAVVWIAHIVYFGFMVKTDRSAQVAD